MNTNPRENFDYNFEDGQEILPGNVVELFPVRKKFWEKNEDLPESIFELEEIGSINNIVNLDEKRKKGVFMAIPSIDIKQNDKPVILFFDCVDAKTVTVDEDNKRELKKAILKKVKLNLPKIKLIPNLEFGSTEREIISESDDLKENIINLFYSRELNQETIEAMLNSIKSNNKKSEEYQIYWTADNFNKNYDF